MPNSCSLRRRLFSTLLLLSLVISCRPPDPPPSADGNTDSGDTTPVVPTEPVVPTIPEPGPLTDSDFWGYWTRSDNFDLWYITDRLVRQVSTDHAIASWNGTTGELVACGYLIKRKSANVLSVNPGAFFLYRESGAKSTLGGKIEGLSQGSGASAKGRALSLAGIGSIEVIVANLLNPANAQLLIPNDDGTFNAPEIIPSDTYTVATIITNGGVETAGPAITVTPYAGMNDLGTITVTKLEKNFKVSCRRIDLPYALANGGAYDYELTFKNIGTAKAEGLSLSIDPDPSLNVVILSTEYPPNQDGSLNLGTIGGQSSPAQKIVSLRATCAGITDEIEYKKITLTLVDSDEYTWNDSVSLKFYRGTKRIKVASLGSRVFCHVFAPEEDGIWFNTNSTPDTNRYENSIVIPYTSRGYKISFSKGTGAAAEVKYSFGIASDSIVEPASSAAITAWSGPAREPNDGEEAAWPVAFGEAAIDSLTEGDLDFYDIGGKTSSPVISPAGGAYTDDAISVGMSTFTPEADIYYRIGSSESIPESGIKYTGPFTVERSETVFSCAIKRDLVDPIKSLADSDIVSASFAFSCLPCVIHESTEGKWEATTDTNGATIRFTRDGTEPTAVDTGETYDSLNPPLPDPAQYEVLIFKAFREGWETSPATVNRGPYPSFTVSSVSVNKDESVSFDASPTSDRDTPSDDIQVSWDFGDGTTTAWSTTKTASHGFSTGGIKTVRLSARDKYGMVEETTKKVLVMAHPWTDFALVYVSGGSFSMGYDVNTPIHTVTLSSFCISKYEITHGQYDDYMTIPTGSRRKTESNIPVQSVSWYDAVRFCNRLSIAEGLETVYSYSGDTNPMNWPSSLNTDTIGSINCDWTKVGYRLPTEAEWEYAARGGVLNGNHLYPGSDSYDAIGWHSGNSNGNPQPIGTKDPNELVIFDMGGNVAEWCWDWGGSYSTDPQTDPKGWWNPATTGYQKIVRGGSWNNSYSWMQPYMRDDVYFGDTVYYYGFRPAINVFLDTGQ